MRIVTGPTVYLVGRQVVDEEALAAFLGAHDVSSWSTDTDVGAERLVEAAGRVCYMSFAKPRPGGNRAYVGHLLEVGHGSVLEHAVFSLLITGVSRSLTHELVRHRAGFGYSQLSQRFVDESDAEFVEPGAIADDPELHRIWLEAVGASRAAYRELADRLAAKLGHVEDATARRKMAREAARSVLPNATETKVFVTGNARALRHFVAIRGGYEADAEIRRLGVAVARTLIGAATNLYQDVSIHPTDDGIGRVIVQHAKV